MKKTYWLLILLALAGLVAWQWEWLKSLFAKKSTAAAIPSGDTTLNAGTASTTGGGTSGSTGTATGSGTTSGSGATGTTGTTATTTTPPAATTYKGTGVSLDALKAFSADAWKKFLKDHPGIAKIAALDENFDALSGQSRKRVEAFQDQQALLYIEKNKSST